MTMKNKALSRSQIREVAFQALFPLDFNEELTKKDAIDAVFQMDKAEWLSDDQTEFVPVYLDTLVDGVCEKKEDLDKVIASHLSKNWTLNRIAKTDLIILRIAIFEMMFVPNEDVPQKVALNEALELAKTYSDDTSRRFINGVLSAVMNELDK